MTILTIASIGSPWLRRVVSLTATRSASFFDNSCFYGQISSAAEAVQMAAHALGIRQLPDFLAPLLTGPEGFINEPALELLHDRIFVEIGTRRIYALDGVHISPSLLRRFLAGCPRLADAALRYWPDAEARRAHLATLADEPEMRNATKDELWILHNIAVSIQDDDQITLDLRRLHAMLGDRMVIIGSAPQRNIADPAENRLQPVLSRISRQLNIPFVDTAAASAETWQEFAGADEPAEADFQSYFEIVFANALIEKFIEPARKLMARTMEAGGRQRAGSTGKRASRRPGRATRPAHEDAPARPDPVLCRYEAGNAAWVANWPNTAKAVGAAIAAGDSGAETARLGLRAAWYMNELPDALRYFELRVQSGALAPAELLDGVEIAFQLGRRETALDWAMAAIRAEPALAEPALRLVQIHGCEDQALPLLEVAVQGGHQVVDIIQHLHRNSLLRRRIAQDALARWAGEQVEPDVENLLILALRSYNPGPDLLQDVSRARQIRKWCENFTVAALAGPIAARALVRMLNAALEAAEAENLPCEAMEVERIAAELVALEPTNGRAVSYLAQRREAEGRLNEAAQLLEDFAIRNPGSAAVQGKRILQWLKANDLVRAYGALREAEVRHRNNHSLKRLRQRVLSAVATHISGAAPSEREKFTLLMDPADLPS